MKRLVDLLRINEVRFTAIILSVMTIAALISSRVILCPEGLCHVYMIYIC